MSSLNVNTNFPEVAAQLKTMRRDIGDRALRSTVNKVAAIGKTAMSREIRQTYVMSAAEVRAQLVVKKARIRKVTGIVATLAAVGGKRSLNLIRFVEKKVSLAQARSRKKGGTLPHLRVKIKKTGGFKILKNAFIGNKGRTVFEREGSSRLPIKASQTIGVSQMFNTKTVNEEVIDKMNGRLSDTFANEARYYTDRFNNK